MTSAAADPAAAPKVSIVIPIFNEEENLDGLYAELTAALSKAPWPCEVVLVDDGSTDGTFDKLRRLHEQDRRLRVIRFRRNFGQGAALSAGFEHARGDIIVPLDADLQNDPADIEKLVGRLDEGYDVAAGWRKNRQDPFLSRVLPSRIANWVIGRVTGVRLHDYGCTIKAYRASDVKAIPLYSEMHRFILLPAMAAWRGARWCEEVVNHRPRRFGRSKYGIAKTYKVILDLLTVKFVGGYGTRPIYVFGALAMLLWLGASVSGAAVVVRKLAAGHPMIQSPLLLLTVLLVVLSAMCIMLGLLAELMVRAHQESQRTPAYVVRDILE